ncbi:hypothetical protein J6590_052646 [Homalodisca vitripennis]|nr:hypothetical protein J6590_052646 [Homalodisca vitripennis]
MTGVRNFTRFAYPPPESQPSFHPMRKCSSFIGGSRNCSALSTCSFATSRCPVQANARAALVLRHSAWRRSLTARVSSNVMQKNKAKIEDQLPEKLQECSRTRKKPDYVLRPGRFVSGRRHE